MVWSIGTHTVSTSTTFSHTVAEGTDRVLVVKMGFRNGDLAGARYNGVAMTEIGSGVNAPSPNNGTPAMRWWFLINPPVGSHDVTFDTWSGSRPAGSAVVLYGINQTAPHRTPSTNAASGVEISSTNPASVAGDLVLDFFRVGSNSSSSGHAADVSQTEIYIQAANAGHVGSSYKEGVSSQTPMEWTWTSTNSVAHAAAAFIPAGEIDPPDGTVTIGATETKSTSLTFTFSDTSTNSDGYEYRIDGGAPVDIGDPSPQAHKLFGLTPSTTYDDPGLQVRAYNLDGPGEWSTAVPFTTIAAAAPVFARLNKTFHLQSQGAGESIGVGTAVMPINASSELGAGVALYRHRRPITRAMTIRKPFVVVTANDKTEASTFTLIDNGTATDVVITVPAGEIDVFTDAVNAHMFNGSTEGWWEVTGGAGGSITMRAFGHEHQPSDEDVIFTFIGPHSAGEAAFGSASTTYLLPIGSRIGTATETQAEFRNLFPSTLRDLRVAGSNAGSSETFVGTATVGFRKDGVDTDVTALWDSANETGGADRQMVVTNLVDTAALSPGDDITLFARPDGGATGGTRDVTWMGALESDNSGGAGEFLLAVGSTSGFTSISTGTYYIAAAGEGMYRSDATQVQTPVPFDARLYRFTARVSDTNSGACTITLRRNGVDTDLSLSFATTDTGVTKQFPIDEFEDFEEGDLIDYKVVHTAGAALRLQFAAIAGAAIGEEPPAVPTPYQPMMMSPF